LISYRGPFGNGFQLPVSGVQSHNEKQVTVPNPPGHKTHNPILCIGGGYGVVPLYFLCKTAKEHGIDAYAVIGGRNEKDILFEKHLFVVCTGTFVTTDDGSKGKKGTTMVEFEWLLKEKKFDCVYTCGPEKMMKVIAEKCVALGIPCQVSLERHMKCGIGVCGSCAINGVLTCKDGPVFSAEQVLKFSEFGKVSRDGCGNKKEM